MCVCCMCVRGEPVISLIFLLGHWPHKKQPDSLVPQLSSVSLNGCQKKQRCFRTSFSLNKMALVWM